MIRRLQEYEQIKEAANNLDELPRVFRDVVPVLAKDYQCSDERPQAKAELSELIHALQNVLKRADLLGKHEVQAEILSVRERMVMVLDSFTT